VCIVHDNMRADIPENFARRGDGACG
jgi:hypothetical protein